MLICHHLKISQARKKLFPNNWFCIAFSTQSDTFIVKHLFPHSLILQLNWVCLTALSTWGHSLHVQSHLYNKQEVAFNIEQYTIKIHYQNFNHFNWWNFLKWKDKSKKCLQHNTALSFQSLLLGMGKLLIQILSSRTCWLLCCVIVCIHPQFFPSLCSSHQSSFLTYFFLSFLQHLHVIHSSFFINLHSQRIYNGLSQHCLYFFIFFQIAIFPLTMQQSIKHTWKCEHAVQCSIKVAWVVVALKTSHFAALFFLQGLWWHCYAFDVWRRQTSKGWNRATKKPMLINFT